MTTTTNLPPTYAEIWAESINETYVDDRYDLAWSILLPDHMDDEDWYVEVETRRVLVKAAECLRGGKTHTFTGPELDLVRHLMPAHEVHQSGTARFVLENYGNAKAAK
ncbi:hypothetical protein [Mycolicibacterium tusciae]|uniref:hypothetical protein n=1 Tax=Mycolicibacterium tusciae TaxID=75922 RepID=UPI00024A1F5B|nr:hypothetical protein [Mycolicibacterium tusciae]